MPDPYLERGLAAWSLTPEGAGTLRTLGPSDGDALPPGGVALVENAPGQAPVLASTARVPVSRLRTYEVAGALRRLTPTDRPGYVVLRVDYFDAARAPLTSQRLALRAPADDAWAELRARFGAGTEHPVPAGAQYVTVAAQLNADDAGAPSDSVYQVTGLSLVHSTPPLPGPLVFSPSTGGCPSNVSSANGSIYASRTFTLPRRVRYEAHAHEMSRATGSRYMELLMDGVAQDLSYVETGTLLWAQHTLMAVGHLAAGTHTLALRAQQLPDGSGYGCGPTYGKVLIQFHEPTEP